MNVRTHKSGRAAPASIGEGRRLRFRAPARGDRDAPRATARLRAPAGPERRPRPPPDGGPSRPAAAGRPDGLQRHAGDPGAAGGHARRGTGGAHPAPAPAGRMLAGLRQAGAAAQARRPHPLRRGFLGRRRGARRARGEPRLRPARRGARPGTAEPRRHAAAALYPAQGGRARPRRLPDRVRTARRRRRRAHGRASLHRPPAARDRGTRNRPPLRHPPCRRRDLPPRRGGRHRRSRDARRDRHDRAGRRRRHRTLPAGRRAHRRGGHHRRAPAGERGPARRHGRGLLGRGRPLHRAGLPLQGGRPDADQLPPAPLDALHAGLRLRRHRADEIGLRRGAGGGLPLLFLRRRLPAGAGGGRT